MKQNLDRFKIAIFDKSLNVIMKHDAEFRIIEQREYYFVLFKKVIDENGKRMEKEIMRKQIDPKYTHVYAYDEWYSSMIDFCFGDLRNIEEYQDNFIILQSTGLKDKNGNLIYEGDVVYIAGTGNYVVSPMEIYSIYAYLYSNDNMVKSVLMDALAEGDIGEVIGNIHTHPELLNI